MTKDANDVPLSGFHSRSDCGGKGNQMLTVNLDATIADDRRWQLIHDLAVATCMQIAPSTTVEMWARKVVEATDALLAAAKAAE